MSNDTAIFLAAQADAERAQVVSSRVASLATASARIHGTRRDDAVCAIWDCYYRFGPVFLDRAEARLVAAEAAPEYAVAYVASGATDPILVDFLEAVVSDYDVQLSDEDWQAYANLVGREVHSDHASYYPA